jgi:NAD(P)-dependent dehydrogenase (short-subunit alcohol dehydrogenase family)
VADVNEETATAVAEGLTSEGHKAVPLKVDVTDPSQVKAMVARTVAEFGGVDVLVNNAGILRDGYIPGLTEQQWDDVIAVHLKGHFAVLHHASVYWKERSKAGEQVAASVINTASASGTFMPNAGQANYGAAKAAIAALSIVAAQELPRYGVRVNCIAPNAPTRLTLATPGMGALFAQPVAEGEFDAFSPANISPLVAYLATEKCPHNGKVFGVQGGAIQELVGWQVSRVVDTSGPWTIDDVAERTADWA